MKKRYIVCFVMLIVVLLSANLSNVFAVKMEPVVSDAAVLMEVSSSKVLYDKNAEARMEPASITKIMTAILAIENCNLNDVVTVPLDAVSNIPEGYSIAELLPDEQLTVDQLLQLLMVYSANDAANVLAFHVDGSISKFANRMNDKLKELNIKNSHFTNPSGMHDDNHYSTAHDIALLMQYCMKNPTFKKYSSLKNCTVPATNLSAERTFKNTNPMLDPESSYYYQSLVSTKTGFTTPALYCLTSYATQNDLSLICVVLHDEISVNRFSDTIQLFEYGFKNFAFQDIAKKGDVVTQVTVENATSDTQFLDLILDDTIHELAPTDLENLSPQITLQTIPSAPISQGTVLGTATYTLDNQVYSVNLIASHDVLVKTDNVYYLLVAGLILVIIAIILICLFWNKNKDK